MAARTHENPGDPWLLGLGAGALSWAGLWFWDQPGADVGPKLAAGLAFLVAGRLALKAAGTLRRRLKATARRLEAHRPKPLAGSARWAQANDITRATLHRPNGLFLGATEDGLALFHDNETHGLTLAPAGAGKTIRFVVPALAHSPRPMIVTDLKGELAAMTAELRCTRHGHQVHLLNPGRMLGLGTARYNPLQIVLDDLERAPADAIADARAIALQLHPEPLEAGPNRFFREGARSVLTFVLLWICVREHHQGPSLAAAARLVSDPQELETALKLAERSLALAGDVAAMAADLRALMLSGNDKLFEDFRQGALQALAPFNASGWLADVTGRCDFRFADLKGDRPATVYLMTDPTKMAVFAPWIGLMSWAALTELTRASSSREAVGHTRTADNRRVLFLLDEASNYKIEGLPNALTALRGFGIVVHLVFQELEEIARVYGRPALATILSQTSVKQIFGVTSQETAELVSRMLGQKTVAAKSFGLGQAAGDDVALTLSATARPLLTADEIRRLPKDQQLLLIENLPPIKARALGYHEVRPWSDWVAPNPLHDGKPFRGPRAMALRYRRDVMRGRG